MHNWRLLLGVAGIGVLWVGSSAVAAEQLRDPTRPYAVPIYHEAARPQFKVNAIIVSSERRIAIVNGKRVGEGDRIDGATVISISKRELTLDVGDRKLTLGLNNGTSR